MLIVETGSGDPDAESLASVEQADAYFTARGYTLWATLLTAEKEQALRRATDYLHRTYHGHWAGSRSTLDQALDWPRAYVPRAATVLSSMSYWGEAVIPPAIVRACIELAFRAASGELAPDLPGAARVKREKIGPIETEYETPASTSIRYRAIDAMLAPYLRPVTNSIPLVRG